MSKFKIGDKVIGIGSVDHNEIDGIKGTVVYVDDTTTTYAFAVDFGWGFDGHTASGHCPSGNGWWVSAEHLKQNTKATTPSTMAPQTKAIFNHLLNHRSITNVEAQAIYKCRALPRRIADLKEMGVVVDRQHRVDPTGQRYVRYVFSHCPARLVELHGTQAEAA